MTEHPGLEIWSGGQTGVDRAALDVAIELGIPCRGWVPRGRMAEDGPLSDRYEGLIETSSPSLEVRTRRNVRDSDATLIVAFGEVAGGTALARATAERLDRPLLVIDLSRESLRTAAQRVRDWLASLSRPLRLNVAGPRASTNADAYDAARRMLRSVFADLD